MKFILFFSLITAAYLTSSAILFLKKADRGTIEWSEDTRLSWKDFRGEADEQSHFKAQTVAELSFGSVIYEDSAVLDLRCLFVKDSSWTKNRESEVLLKHEQLHFDISELTARQLRREFARQRPSSFKDASTRFEKIYRNYTRKNWQEINARYDSETNHGTIDSKQQQWEKRIAADLKQLANYANPVVVVNY